MNYLINYPFKPIIFKSDIGNIRINTFFVNKKELFEILKLIKNKENSDNIIKIIVKIKKR